jgi:hypothetical protein
MFNILGGILNQCEFNTNQKKTTSSYEPRSRLKRGGKRLLSETENYQRDN